MHDARNGPVSGDLPEILRFCLDHLPVGVFVLDDELRFLYANAELARINGNTVADHVGHGLLDVLPSIAPTSWNALQDVLRTGIGVDDVHIDRMLTDRRSYSLSYRRMTLPDGRHAIFGSIADVSERARQAELGRTLGERLGRLRDANVVGVMIGEDTRIVDANDYVLEMLGRDRADLDSGRLDWTELTPPEFAEQDRRIVAHMLAHREAPAFTKEFLHADGRRVPVVLASTAFGTEPLRWLALLMDTSAIRRSERRAGSLVRLATELATARTLDEVLALVPLVDDPATQLTARVRPPGSLPSHEPAGPDGSVRPDRSGDGDREGSTVIEIPIADLSERPVAVVELDFGGGELGVVERSFATAVEALLSATATQIAMREQRRMAEIAGALDVMLDMVAIDAAVRDDAGEIVDFDVEWVNRATSDAFGRSQQEIIGSTMLTLYPELRGSRFFEEHCRVVETGVPFEDPEFLFVPAQPGVAARVYELRVSRFGDGFISCSRDVTERTEAVRAVRRSQQQLEAAESLARMGSWEADLDTGEQVWSRELYRILAIDPDLAPAERDALVRERVHPADRRLFGDALARAADHGGSFRHDLRLLLPDGERIAVIEGEVVVEDAGGRTFRGTLRDVTEWRRAQDESKHGRQALEAMQRACLPDELPAVPGLELAAHYRPAHAQDRLGGDWYDAFDLPGGRIGLVVGDVTGHGLAAAVVMSQLRNALRAYASEGASPASVLDALATFAVRRIDSLATCLYAVVDPTRGSITWARAGHPPPLIVVGDTWRAPEEHGGPPLGVAARPFAEQCAELPDGALLVLYTDGLVEERSQPIDVGIGALGRRAVAHRADPIEVLVSETVTELGDRRIDVDDLCLLVVRRGATR